MGVLTIWNKSCPKFRKKKKKYQPNRLTTYFPTSTLDPTNINLSEPDQGQLGIQHNSWKMRCGSISPNAVIRQYFNGYRVQVLYSICALYSVLFSLWGKCDVIFSVITPHYSFFCPYFGPLLMKEWFSVLGILQG